MTVPHPLQGEVKEKEPNRLSERDNREMERKEETVFPMSLLKITTQWVVSCYRAARKFKSYGFIHRNQSSKPHQIDTTPLSPVVKCSLEGSKTQTLVCDFQGALLRSSSPFPFFMLVAFEGGSLLRALFLLVSCPLLWAVGHNSELGLRVMVFITFCGLRVKNMELVARAVLPKFYLEDLHLHAYEVLASAKKSVVISTMPRVMVEWFLREYLSVCEAVGTELQVVGRRYTGLMRGPAMALKHMTLRDLYGEVKADVALVSSSSSHDDHVLVSYCKEAYAVNKNSGASAVMPREKYPKPLVFHDGRLAFLPSPSATIALFLWLPLGIFLSIFRILLGVLFPYKVIIIVTAFTGVRLRVHGLANCSNSSKTSSSKGVLYVCSHRTLLDPVILSTMLCRPVPVVTYSVSLTSELIAPMKTVRLTRDRIKDGEAMKRLLMKGDLAVCPEGTTCREPYLLRFSSLFAELTDDIVPVAVYVSVSMTYGTTASGIKGLDPLFFLMNPTPLYQLKFLKKVPRELTCAGGWSAPEVANRIQQQLAEALGFQPTSLTRRDKYMILAGNEGVVSQHKSK